MSGFIWASLLPGGDFLSHSAFFSSDVGSMFSQAMKKWVQGNSDEVRQQDVEIFMKGLGGLRLTATRSVACVSNPP